MGGWGLFDIIGVMGFYCAKTEWNSVLSRCGLCSGVVTRVVVFKSSYVTGVLSMHLEELIEMVVSYIICEIFTICLPLAFSMFLTNIFLKDLKVA